VCHKDKYLFTLEAYKLFKKILLAFYARKMSIQEFPSNGFATKILTRFSSRSQANYNLYIYIYIYYC